MKTQYNYSYTFFILLLGGILGVAGCKDPNPQEDLSFDQTALLNHLGNNIIVPNYEDLEAQMTRLRSAADDFENASTAPSLEALRTEFKAAYTSWMYCSTFEFGPASDRTLRAQVNTFPTDADAIDANVLSGTYDLASATNIDAKGFPALDYLLFGLDGSESNVLAAFNEAGRGENLLAYLQDLILDIQTLTRQVLQSWNESYRASFVDNLGTNVGSSMGLFINQLNFDYEILKKPRLGIPLGVQTLGTPLPESVEAYYSGFSNDLMLAHFDAISNLYFGTSRAGVNGYGIDDALDALEAQYNGGALSAAIAAQITATRNGLADVPAPLSDAVVNNAAVVDAAYREVQKLVVLFKTDMTSSLGVLITYVDNDGD